MLKYLILLCCCLCVHGTYVSDEQSLRSYLFSNYNAAIRPNDTTNVSIFYYTLSLNSLDIGQQQMSFSLIFMLAWNDYRLAWTPSSYGNIDSLVEPTESVWVPKIIIENDVSKDHSLPETSKSQLPLRIMYDGSMAWSMMLHTSTTCEMSITFYPFDTQTCSISMTSFAYDSSRVALDYGGSDTTYYVESGEWELMGITRSSGGFSSPHGVFTRMFLNFTFRRRWQFYGLNLVMPIILTSFLMCAVFALPVDTGEKMGYCVTILLSFVVFLTWITDTLPAISTGTSIIQVYLAIVLCMGVLATLMTVWVLGIHHRPPSYPMSTIMRFFVYKVLLPFHRRSCSKKSSTVAAVGGQTKETEKGIPYEKKARIDKDTSNQEDVESSPYPGGTPMGLRNRDKSNLFVSPTTKIPLPKCDYESDEREEPEVSWPEVAAMIDSMTLWLLTPMKVLLSIVIVVVLYAFY